MRRRIRLPIVIAVALGMLMVPLQAGADTVAVIAFVNGKAVVQCPPDANGNTGLGAPGLGINKGKNCSWGFSNVNAHKVPSGVDLARCIGAGASDPLKKDLKKPLPQVAACSITASGTLGPRVHSSVASNIGPWCGASNGNSGSGMGTVGTKSVSVERIRFQSQGTLILVTGTAFKPGVQKPGQAGPVLAVVQAFADEHKLTGAGSTTGSPQPNSSCTSNNKNFKVHGIVIAVLFGSK